MADGHEEQHNNATHLNFSNEFHGRQEELNRLHDVYKQVCGTSLEDKKEEDKIPTDGESQFVVLAGYSGTGKSALVKKFVEQVHVRSQKQIDTKSCYFLRGKFDENQSAAVFSGLIEAFSGFLSKLIADGDKREIARVREGIRLAMSDDGRALAGMFPDLARLMADPSTNDNATASRASTTFNPDSNQNAWHKLAYAFKCFVQIICSERRPVIIFIDDLQWADEASLDLITDLLLSKSIQNLMFIGAFRNNEVDESHPLTIKLNIIEKSKTIERINILNMSQEYVAEFIANTLRLEVDEVGVLADVIYSKTQGNIFFTMQTLDQLYRKKVLYKSMATLKWTWDNERVAEESTITDNVIDLVNAKIQSLPFKVQETLAVASFLRTTFDAALLLELTAREKCDVATAEELVEVLDIAAEEGLLDNVLGSESYRFSHDRIRQASYALVPPGEDLDHMRMRIGKHLLELSESEMGTDWMLFVATDHLNSVSCNNLDTLEMVRLNLQVGERAIGVSAFLPASKYLGTALRELEKLEDPWKNHYNICLRAHQSAAEVELCLGNFESGSEISQVIFDKVDDVLGKLPSYVSLADGMGKRMRHAEALVLNMKSLELLKSFPRKNHLFHALISLIKVNKLLKKYSDYDIMLLPMMTDEKKLYATAILTSMALRAYHCGKVPVVLLCILTQIIMTFKYGLFPDSAVGFSTYGMLLSGVFGDQEGGKRLGRLSKNLLEVTGARERRSHVLFTVVVYIDAWAVPIPQILETFQKSHASGMESGDLEMGFRAWASSSVHAYAAGFPLDAVEATADKLQIQLEQYQVLSVGVMYDYFRQTLAHLTGSAKSPLDWNDFGAKPPKKLDTSETFRWIWYYWSRTQLAFYFGKLELANSMVESFTKIAKVDTSYIATSIRIFISGLIASGLARQTKKRKYIARARKATKEMKGIMTTRGLNNLHRYLLMEADLLACTLPKSKEKRVKQAYDKGIAAAGKAGFTQDAALGNELAGEYFLSIDDPFWPSHYFTQAYNLYHEWGAKAKVEHIHQHRGTYIEKSELNRKRATTTSSNKHWVSGAASEIHNAINLDRLPRHISSPESVTFATDDKSTDSLSQKIGPRLSRLKSSVTKPTKVLGEGTSVSSGDSKPLSVASGLASIDSGSGVFKIKKPSSVSTGLTSCETDSGAFKMMMKAIETPSSTTSIMESAKVLNETSETSPIPA